MSIVTYENVDTPVFEIDFPRYLFANGEAGFWLTYQPGHLYADVDKTVPATADGGIASFDDLSGNGVTGPQPTSTARPIFRASPARGEYDSADDVLPRDALLPAITDGTVILIGQQGIWIDEGYSFAGGNWSFGPTTYPNGPAGIIGVVGDMLNLVVLDRPLTADERDRVVAYGVKRGSAGLIELGPELVVNGDFSDGATGWSIHASASVVDGRIVFDGVTPVSIGTVLAEASGSPLPDAGLHIVEFSITEDTIADISLRFGGDVGRPRSSYGVYRRIVNGVSERASVRARTTAGVRAGSVDNVSARRLIMPGETP